MDKKNFLLLLEEVLEFDPGTLVGDEKLDDLDEWDSLATVGFISLVDEHYGFTLLPQQLAHCDTVQDLLTLVSKQVTA